MSKYTVALIYFTGILVPFVMIGFTGVMIDSLTLYLLSLFVVSVLTLEGFLIPEFKFNVKLRGKSFTLFQGALLGGILNLMFHYLGVDKNLCMVFFSIAVVLMFVNPIIIRKVCEWLK